MQVQEQRLRICYLFQDTVPDQENWEKSNEHWEKTLSMVQIQTNIATECFLRIFYLVFGGVGVEGSGADFVGKGCLLVHSHLDPPDQPMLNWKFL